MNIASFLAGDIIWRGTSCQAGDIIRRGLVRELDPKTERRSQTEAKNNDNHSSGMPTMDQKSFSLFDATNLENLDIDILLDDD